MSDMDRPESAEREEQAERVELAIQAAHAVQAARGAQGARGAQEAHSATAYGANGGGSGGGGNGGSGGGGGNGGGGDGSYDEAADDAIIRAENLVKIYKTKDIEVLALQGLDLVIEHGELMAIIGNSGSGKSTLLNMLGGLDRPSAGSLTVDGKDLFKISESELSDYRRLDVGFVWQSNARNLVPYLSALHNVMLPMNINNRDERLKYETQRREWAIELLNMVGLASSAKKRLAELSGGEQQRVALAIGLSNRPKILLADEPTGSVDQATCRQIMDIFRRFNQVLGVTIIIVTHDRTLTKMVNRVVAIRDGKTSSEILVKENLRERLASITDFEGIETHEEFAVLDRVGRVQIPEDFLHRLDLSGNTVKLEFNDGQVTMTKPDRTN